MILNKRVFTLKDIEAVIFDLDGSLVDSMWIWEQIDIEYLGRFGISLPEGLQSDVEGMSFSETAYYFKDRFQLPDSIETIKDDWNKMAWDKYSHEIPLKNGVDLFLDYCKNNHIKLGIATSNSRQLVDNITAVHGLNDYFSSIVTSCDVGRGKPAPDIYFAVAKELEAVPERCLVFEDIIPGIQAGKSAGMKVCAVEDLYTADLRDEKMLLADYFIDDFMDLSYLY